MPNRKKAQDFILHFMGEFDKSGYNKEVYEEIFKDMSDKDFDEYMKGLATGEKTLVAFKPAYKANGISVENNIKLGEKYGVKFFEKLNIETKEGISYKTPIEYLVVDLPYRRQSQNLIKKINIPEHNKSIDETTYQPTSDSKGAKISYPELQVLIGMGLDNTIEELIKYRGGDKRGFAAYNAMFNRYGNVSIKALQNYSSGVESTKTLKSYLIAAHLNANV